MVQFRKLTSEEAEDMKRNRVVPLLEKWLGESWDQGDPLQAMLNVRRVQRICEARQIDGFEESIGVGTGFEELTERCILDLQSTQLSDSPFQMIETLSMIYEVCWWNRNAGAYIVDVAEISESDTDDLIHRFHPSSWPSTGADWAYQAGKIVRMAVERLSELSPSIRLATLDHIRAQEQGYWLAVEIDDVIDRLPTFSTRTSKYLEINDWESLFPGMLSLNEQESFELGKFESTPMEVK